MGYDVKRFSDLGFLAEDITCPICINVFRDPVTTKCRHTYCRECISEWLARHQTCPLDQLPVNPYDDLSKPPIFVNNILGRLLITCDYKEKGCSTTVKLEDLANHVTNCSFRPKTGVSQALTSLSQFTNRLSMRFFASTSWIHHLNQRINPENPPTPPVRIRGRPRHTELARIREQRTESEREEDLTSFLLIFLILLAVAIYLGIFVRFVIEFLLLFLFEHISIVFFLTFLIVSDLTPQPNLRFELDELLP